MAIGGKFWGGLIGFFQGGPLGAIIGATLGHAFFDSGKSSTIENGSGVQIAYITALFSMLAKLAKADGVIDQREAALVSDMIRHSGFNDETKIFARKVFNEAKDQSFSFEDYARDFYRLTSNKRTLHNSILSMLCQVAAADGVLHPKEEACLKSASAIFRISPLAYQAIMAQFFKGHGKTTSIESSYNMLNCTKDSSTAEIKKNYKRLVKEYHPDLLVSKGLPKGLMDQATERFRQVQEAYETIAKARKF